MPPVCSPGSEGTAEEHVKGSQFFRWLIAEQAPDFRGVVRRVRPAVARRGMGVAMQQGDDVVTLDGVIENAALLGAPPVPIKVEPLAIAIMLPDDDRVTARANALAQVAGQESKRTSGIVPASRTRMAILERRFVVGGVGGTKIDTDSPAKLTHVNVPVVV